MSATFGAITTARGDGAGQTTLTWNHTVEAGATGFVVAWGSQFGSDRYASAVSLNGVALTNAAKDSNGTGTVGAAEMWTLLAPPIGTFTVSVTWAGAVRVNCFSVAVVGGSTSAVLVASTAATGKSTTGSPTASALNCVATGTVIGVVGGLPVGASRSFTAGTGVTKLAGVDASTTIATAFGSVPGTTGTVAVPWTNVGVSGDWVEVVAEVADGGTPLAGRTVTWTSSTPAVCAAPADGTTDINGQVAPTISLLAGGSTNLQATCGGTTSNVVAVTVTAPAAVATVAVTPTPVSGTAGTSVTLTAVVKDAVPNVLTGRVVTWATSNATIAGWTGGTGSQLTLNLLAAGTCNVQAWCEGVGSNVVAVTVTALATAVKAVAVSPASLSGTAGGTGSLVATVTDTAGNPVTASPVTWRVSNITLVSVTGTTSPGQAATVTYLAAGAATVTASCGGVDSSPVGVTVGTAVSSVLFPNQSSAYVVPPGFDRDFNATVEGAWALSGSMNIRDGSTYVPVGATAPGVGPASPKNIGESVFSAGTYASSFTPTNAFIPGATMGSLRWQRLYVGMFTQFSSNYWGNTSSGVNKVIIGNLPSLPMLVLSATGMGSAALIWQFRLQDLQVDPNGGARNLSPNLGVSAGTVTRGLWQRVEIECIANTPGSANGVVRLWLTNYNSSNQIVFGPTKITEYTNVGWVNTSTVPSWTGVQWQDIWGGGGGTIPATCYTYMDKIRVAGSV